MYNEKHHKTYLQISLCSVGLTTAPCNKPMLQLAINQCSEIPAKPSAGFIGSVLISATPAGTPYYHTMTWEGGSDLPKDYSDKPPA